LCVSTFGKFSFSFWELNKKQKTHTSPSQRAARVFLNGKETSIQNLFFCSFYDCSFGGYAQLHYINPRHKKKAKENTGLLGVHRMSHIGTIYIWQKKKTNKKGTDIARLTSVLTDASIQKTTRVARGELDYTEIEAGNLAENNPSDSNVQAPQSFQKRPQKQQQAKADRKSSYTARHAQATKLNFIHTPVGDGAKRSPFFQNNKTICHPTLLPKKESNLQRRYHATDPRSRRGAVSVFRR